MGVYNDVSMSLSAGDEANLWVKPLDMVKLSYGKYDNNTLRGDCCYGSWNWLRPTSSWIAEDEGLLMSGNGGTGLLAEVTPIDNLYIQALLPTRTDGKFPRLDIHCKLEDGSEVDVEIQNSMYQDDQVKRSIYYAATLAHNSLSSGEPYSSLAHIYQIMFMDFTTIEDKRLHHAYTFKERDDHTELSDIIQIHYIELPKITELISKPGAELSELEFWSILIMSGENKKARLLLNKLTRMQEEMDMAQALLDSMSRDQQEWENQIGYERFVHDCISREKYAFMQGEKQGGRITAIANAKNFLCMNLGTPEQIAQGTGLPLEQVLALKEELAREQCVASR